MNDVPTFEDVPVFGTSADISKPGPTTYDDGYTGGEVFPAEEENWFMNKLTTNGLTEQDNLVATMQEVISVLTAAGVTPDSGVHDQLATSIQTLIDVLQTALEDGDITVSLADTAQNAVHAAQASIANSAGKIFNQAQCQVFTSSGVYTVQGTPSSTPKIWVSGVGHGGNGGSSSGSNQNGCGGGGAGAATLKQQLTVVPGETLTITIPNTPGSDTTIVGSTSGLLLTLASGGNGGGNGSGAGGGGSGGGGRGGGTSPAQTPQDGLGSFAGRAGNGSSVGGGGATSWPGASGGDGGASGANGGNASGYGAGGGGAGAQAGSAGGSGSKGIIIIEF